jgi:hypothetical protein
LLSNDAERENNTKLIMCPLSSQRSNHAKINVLLEIFALLGCYAAQTGSIYHHSGTTYASNLQGSSSQRGNTTTYAA